MDEILGYHYTSADAFFSMTKKMLEQKSSEKYFEFWASSCLCMNDIVEMKHGYNVLMEILKDLEKDTDKRFCLSNVCKEIKMSDMTDEQIPSFIRDNSFIMDRLPYAISFSFMPEQIPLWAMYADNGKGVCLCFNLSEITRSEELSFVPIIYNYDSASDEIKKFLKDAILPELQNFQRRIEGFTDPEKIWFEKMSSLRVISTVISPYFKHFSFEFENEYRLVKYCGRDTVEYRTNISGSVIPYVKVKIPFTALKKVIIGPCANYKQCSSIIHTYMKYADPQHLVIIEPSLVPYRII